jgi:hypothetical protein
MEDSNGEWQPIKNLMFVPAPVLQRWLATRFRTGAAATAWLRKRAWFARVYPGTKNPVGFMPSGWKDDGNFHYDFATIVMAPKTVAGRKLAIGEALGGVGVSMFGEGANHTVRSLGYPADPPFKGLRLFECDAHSSLGDPFPPQHPTVLAMGCDMTGGSSGGPWFTDLDADGYIELVSVNSYGPPNIMFGPNLSGDHWQAFDAARLE